jgi:hypothetical protein
MVAKKVKPLGDGVDLAVGDFGAAARLQPAHGWIPG